MLVANLFGSRMDAQEVVGYFWILCALMMRAVLMEREERRKGLSRRIKAKAAHIQLRRIPRPVAVT